MATNYQKFSAAVLLFAGETLTTKQLEVLAGEQGLKLANLFPAACSVTKLPEDGETVNQFRAPSSAPYPVLFLLKGRGNYAVLPAEQQYWPTSKGKGTRGGETLEQAQAEITALRAKLAAKQTESEQATV